MENRKAKKPLNKTASKSASDDLYAAHEDDPRPNALYEENGDRKRLDAKKNSQAGLRKEWMDYYIAYGGDYEEKPESSASLEKPETTHCPSKRNNWVVLDYHYNNVELTPVSGMDFCVTCSDGSEINGKLDKNGLCRLDDIPEGNVDVEYGRRDDDDELKLVRAELKATLDRMVNEVAQDSAYLEQELKKRGFLEQQFIHTGARLKGAVDAGEGVLSTAWYVLKKGNELRAKIYKKTYRAIKNFSLDEVRDDLGTLQFQLDVAHNKVQNVYEVLQILAEDPESRDMLINFPKRYLGAMHSTDYDMLIGSLAFEVLIAVLTGGGASAAAVAKSRHFSKVRILVDKLLVILKRRRLRKKKFPGQQKTRVEKDVGPLKRIRDRKFKRAIHPNKRGMRIRDDHALSRAAEDSGNIVLVRDSNPAALDYLGKKGYKPKPEKMKVKTRKTDPNKGLAAADPESPDLKELLQEKGLTYDEYVKSLKKEGLTVYPDEGYIVRDIDGDAFYSDYDLHGVYNFKTGKNAYSDGVRDDLNGRFGEELVQHGPHDLWKKRLLKEAGVNRGPKPPVTAYMPDGSKLQLKTIEDMKAFYKKHDIKWDTIYPGY